MKFSTPFIASELKKELTSFGVKVLMCKSTRDKNAVIAIDGSVINVNLFLEFCNNNNYAGACGLSLNSRSPKTDCKYVDFGNVFKYVEV